MDPNNPSPSPSPKQQVVERIRAAANVLVTVKSNPSVDELAATIGLTLMLNKLGKHATAVFSGSVPSTLEFLKPEETIETNTDSLRDFIVSLDKSKADKLRYKVEENVVKIFITPYRTSITEKDLEFTQGDFNVDVVMALGVTVREELDQAITAHGRILHDATVVSVIAGQRESSLGSINWQEPAASSLSEMLVSISEAFQGGLIDAQMATAFLTGIVAETERFSNTKTSPKVMTMAAQLMAAGANQQLIATELQKNDPVPVPEAPAVPIPASEDGSLDIEHTESADDAPKPEEAAPTDTPAPETPPETKPDANFLPPLPPSEAGESFEPLMPVPDPDVVTPTPLEPEPVAEPEPAPESKPEPTAEEPAPVSAEPVLPPPPEVEEPPAGEIEIDHEGNMMRANPSPKHKMITPLSDSSRATDDNVPSFLPPAADDGTNAPMFNPLDEPPAAELPPVQRELPPPPPPRPDMAPAVLPDDTTLIEIEESVHSPHLEQQDAARDAVQSAISQAGFDPSHEVRKDLNAMPLGNTPPAPNEYDAFRLPTPTDSSSQAPPPLPGQETPNDPMAPPPVPPPLNLPQ